MAVTWTAAAPHVDAIKDRNAFGVVQGSASVSLPNFGGKRRVLTKLTGAGTYTAGGDALPLTSVGLSEVHRLEVIGASNVNFDPVNSANAIPVLAGTAKIPLVKLITGGTDVAGATAVGTPEYTVILEGV